jgi:exonuclease V
MASHAAEGPIDGSINDDETDYGSDFSPEEEQQLLDLVSGQQQVKPEDNPIVTEVEHHDEQTLRLPRTLGRELRSPLFQAARAAEEVAGRISRSVQNGSYTDRKSINPKVLQEI